jgi:photosystem II stability/assembly factor-like uncharacterized protein
MNTGAVLDLAFSPNFVHDGFCLAATVGGLLTSHDGGHTWASHPLFKGEVTTCLAISPGFPQDHTLLVGLPGGVLRSTDAGESWTTSELAFSTSPQPSVLALSPNYQRDGIALAGTFGGGIYRTGDRALRWQPWNFGLLDLSVMSLGLSPAFEEDETIFAGTSTGLFRSKNGGLAWREVDIGGEVSVISLAMSPNFALDGELLLGTEEVGLYHSNDRGSHWQRLESWQIEGPANALHFVGDDTLLAASNSGVYTSNDTGQTWALLAGLPSPLCLASPPDCADTLHPSLSGPDGVYPPDGAIRVFAGTAEAGIWYQVPGTQDWNPASIVG